MRIVTWNCNSGFRNKVNLLDAFDADVLVIQECEEPSKKYPDYRNWAGKHIWAGTNPNRGIGIFVKPDMTISRLGWSHDNASHFLPVIVNETWQIVGVWTQKGSEAKSNYIGQLGKFLEVNKEKIDPKTVLCGDFNSNPQLDKPNAHWSHLKCVAELHGRGLTSLYHETRLEAHGEESCPTFFMYRNQLMPFHLDYVFVHRSVSLNKECSLIMGEAAHWLKHSDHLPLVFDV